MEAPLVDLPLEEEVVDVEDKLKMREEFKCPLCKEELYSGLGKGCAMCGMPLEENQEFCSNICKERYIEINLQYPKGHKGGKK